MTSDARRRRRRFVEVRRELLRAIYDAGGKLLVGSDSPQFFGVSGYAALREILREAVAAPESR